MTGVYLLLAFCLFCAVAFVGYMVWLLKDVDESDPHW